MYYVYILYSAGSGKTYTGFTNDVDRRLIEHNVTESKGFTLRYRPWTMMRVEQYPTKAEAMAREKFLKSGRGRDEIRNYLRSFLDAGAVSAAAEKDRKSLCRRFDPAPHHKKTCKSQVFFVSILMCRHRRMNTFSNLFNHF
jgi:putative endonuclease